MHHRRVRQGACAILMIMPCSVTALATPLPTIQKLTLTATGQTFSAKIAGTNFGSSPVALPCEACDIPELAILDVGDVNLSERPTVTGWTNTAISLTRVGGKKGDAIWVSVRNDALANYAVWSGNLPGAPHPTIKGVSFSGTGKATKITIIGSGFGSPPPGIPGTTDLGYFELWPWSVTHPQMGNVPWSAGYTGQGYTDSVSLHYTYWSETQIVVEGFGSAYGTNGWTFGAGDPYVINVFRHLSNGGAMLVTGKGGRVP